MRKEMIYFFIFFICCISVNGDIVINEIMYNPIQSNFYNEWIEIYNNGNKIVNLTNWNLCNSKLLSGYVNHNDKNIYLDTTMVLESNQYAVITDGGTGLTKGTEVYNNFDVNENSIALHIDGSAMCNSGLGDEDIIIIKDPEENIKDEVSYSNKWGNDKKGFSLELINPDLSNNIGDNWGSSNEEGGTPGEQNSIFESLDEIAPIINLIYPRNNSYLNFNNINFSFRVVDNSEILNCSLYLNDVLNQTNETVLNDTLTYFSVFNLSEGVYGWNISCYDKNNNVNTSEKRLFNVDTINPDIFLDITPSILEFGVDNTTINFTIIDTNLDTTVKNLTWPNGTLYFTFINNLTLTTENLTVLGNYTVYLWANDSSGRENILEYDIKVQDIIAPYFINNITKIINIDFLIINFTTNENANVTFNYGTDLNLTKNVSESNFSNNHSIKIFNLSSNTIYYYNLTVCDESNNCNVSDGDFTTLEIIQDGNGGNNGGGGGSSSPNIYNIEINELSSLSLARNDKVEFNFNGEGHSLKVDSIYTDYIIITVSSTPQEIRINMNEVKYIDLNLDGEYDIYVKVNDIIYNNVDIEIKKVIKEIVEETKLASEKINEEKQNETVSNNLITGAVTGEIKSSPIIGGIIIFSIIIIGLIFYFTFKKRK